METARKAEPRPGPGPAAGRRRGRGGRGPRRPKIQAQAWELGREHELGEVLTYRQQATLGRRRRWGYGLAIGAGVIDDFLLVIALAPGLAAGPRVALVAVAAALLAAGATLAWTAPPATIDRVFAYTGGLAQVRDGQAAPRVIPWVLVDYAEPGYRTWSRWAPAQAIIRVVGLDGTVITVDDSSADGSGLRPARYIDMMLVAMRLPPAVERCTSGAPAQFGELSVTRDGIGWEDGARWTAWSDVHAVRLTRNEIRLDTGAPSGRQAIALAGVPDAPVAVLLIQELAGQLGVRQDKPPVYRPAPPPDQDRLRAARVGVLPEADVSEILGRPVELAARASCDGSEIWRFRGGDARLKFVVVGCHASDRGLYRAWGRCLGRRVARVGQWAWLLRGQRTLIAADGPRLVKLTLSGLPRDDAPAPLIRLARLALDRLAPDRLAPDRADDAAQAR